MRNVLVPLLYIWLFVSVGVLIHRRLTTGSFRPSRGSDRPGRDSTAPALIDRAFSPPPSPPPAPSTVPDPPRTDPAPAPVARDPEPTADPAPTAVEDRPSTLAEAVAGISMPCGLVPAVSDRDDPRHVAFSTTGHEPSTVGSAMADELELLGFEITPLDDRSVRAARPDAELELRIWSSHLDPAEVFAERFPGVAAHSLVVDIRLR